MTGGMTDAELFGAAPTDAPAAQQGDPAIWTVLGEAGGDKEGQRAVASVIANRAKRIGAAPVEIVGDPAQGFEAWTPAKRAALQKQYPPGSPAYEAAQANVGAIIGGREASPYAFDSFYSPSAQSALGRKPPSWEDGSGQDIGGNRFFAGKFGGAPILSDEDKAEWQSLYGDRGVAITPTGETPRPGLPSSTQGDTARFLSLHGFSDPQATAGSAQNPVYEADGTGVPTTAGTWYVPRAGGLRRVGDEQDYLPTYRALVASQKAEMEKPLLGRLGLGAGQGASDVGGSINRLLGGVFSASPEGQFAGEDYTAAPDLAATQGYEDQRNRFNLLHGPDTAATIGRIGGNIAATAPFMPMIDAPLGALGATVGRLAPAARQMVDFLGGTAGEGNLLLHAPSRAARGAVEGMEATALNAGQSDRPLGEQLRHGARVGAAFGAAIPAAGAVGNLLTGAAGARVAPEVAQLADLATTKYGIPLRRTQVLGVGDRNAAIADSEMIGRGGTGYADNLAAQRKAFARSIAGTFGEDADALTPDVMSRARSRIGGEFDRVARNATIGPEAADQLQSRLGNVISEAQQVLPEPEVAPLLKLVQNVGATRGEGGISGDSYQALTRTGSPLDRAAESSNANIRYYAQQIRNQLDDALESSISPQDSAALQQARWQYKNLMTLKNLANKAGVTGDVPPALLNGAVNTSFKNRAFSGAGDLGELAQIGQTFMREPPNSGTAPRLRNMLLPGLLGGAGAADMMLAVHDPGLAMKMAGAGVGLGALRYGANAASGAFNRSPGVVNRLIQRSQADAGVGDARPAIAQVIGNYASPAYVPLGVLAERNKLLALPGP